MSGNQRFFGVTVSACWLLTVLFAIVAATVSPGAITAAVGCGIAASIWSVFTVAAWRLMG